MSAALYWREIHWLWLAGLPLLLWLLNRWQQQRKWLVIADSALLPWVQGFRQTTRNKLRLLSLLTGWLLLCVALAGPRSIEWIPPEQRPDPASVIFIVDLSASMNAQDIRPDRRGASQRLVEQWLAQNTTRISTGFVLFAGHPFELSPLTSDQTAQAFFTTTLKDIRLPTLGNNLPAALQLASSMWPQDTTPKRLIIFSDGDMEDALQQSSSQSLQALAATAELQITLIGVGTPRAVTLPDTSGEPMTQQSRPVLSRLQAGWMKSLARQHSTISYLQYDEARRKTLPEILQLPPLQLDEQARAQTLWREWFDVFLVGGLLFIALSLSPLNNTSGVVKYSFALAVIGLLISSPSPLLAASADAADDYDARFDRATRCYRAEDYGCARTAFNAAIQLAQTDTQKARAIFNLANSYFFLGDYDQAEVLYRDAGLHGIDQQLVDINLGYARAMQDALQRQISDIRETLRRARWRADASDQLPPELDDLLANDRSMMMPRGLGDKAQTFYRAYQKAVRQQLNQMLGIEQKDGPEGARKWVKTEQQAAQSSAALFGRLFEMESGILAPQAQPQAIRGMRKW